MDRAKEMMLFVRVVEEGSFSAASRSLDLTPSAVSKQISRLETRLSVRLFNRTTRRLHLTEAGQRFYDHCARISADIERAEAEISDYQQQVRGTLRISGTTLFTRTHVVPYLNAFQKQHPGLKIHLQLTDYPVDIIGEGWDVAIQFSEQFDDPSLVARRLATNTRIVCASPAYLRERGTPAVPQDLMHHNCLSVYTVSRFNNWEFSDGDTREVLQVVGNLEINTADAMLEALLSGAGIARVSIWLGVPYLKTGELVQILPKYSHQDSAFYLVYPTRQHLSRKVRVFVDYLVDLYTPDPPWSRGGGRLLQGIG
ncbi:MAG: LysR family transcriptional regulator [Gammaproteobacteria bacterium]|nr:LysR family transcriptional regulator [Gammaproteobacteria bacterium]